jgi:hypothetical protein
MLNEFFSELFRQFFAETTATSTMQPLAGIAFAPPNYINNNYNNLDDNSFILQQFNQMFNKNIK